MTSVEPIGVYIDSRIDRRRIATDVLCERCSIALAVVALELEPIGNGHSAGFYSYLWSDVLSADAWEAFTEGKGDYDNKVGDPLVKNIFSVGNIIDPAEGYQRFPAAIRKSARGFPVTK